jgi:hypothetical protein
MHEAYLEHFVSLMVSFHLYLFDVVIKIYLILKMITVFQVKIVTYSQLKLLKFMKNIKLSSII